ncbi:MAG: tRNA 4-thiouridine(8) synthase ThiI [Deltaproteobacteria bacterium]|nr:tRNA 4-thiouridine(8) synthase ThiI [Deltaproteobacteria bacterium]
MIYQEQSTPKPKGIGLVSGGLDSLLAVRVLQDQNLEVMGVTFFTPFFGPEQGLAGGKALAIPMRVLDISRPYLEMLKSPRYGYGSQANPCIDCHALMLREAGRVMEEMGARFLFTGEVLGQRPMSQRRDSLRSVENLSGFAGLVLRPLSAKLLPPTLVELEGLVDRERLLDIQGRSRKRQEALADRYGIVGYPQPAGGCILTKEGFARKLTALFQSLPGATPRQAELIRLGRFFRLPGGNVLLVGRNRLENERLETAAADEDGVFRVLDFPGPLGLLIGHGPLETDFQTAAQLVLAYSDAPDDHPVAVKWRHKGETGVFNWLKPQKELFASCHV